MTRGRPPSCAFRRRETAPANRLERLCKSEVRGLAEGGREDQGCRRMLRSRVTWIIFAALVVLIVVAGLDALRSPDKATSASTTTAAKTAAFSPTTTVVTVVEEGLDDAHFVMDQAAEDMVDEAGNPLPACASPEQLMVSVHARVVASDAVIYVWPVENCRQDYPYFRVTVGDGAGKQLLVWSGRLMYNPRSSPKYDDLTYAYFGPVPCEPGHSFLALVTVGYDPAPQGHSFRIEGICA